MLPTRPVECPACGHDGIRRSLHRTDPDGGSAGRGSESWTCRLCDYTWSRQAAGNRRGTAGPDALHF